MSTSAAAPADAGLRQSLRRVALFCLAEMLTMSGFALVPTLLPAFSTAWGLSATAAGWLSGAFFLGYIVAVPLLVGATDRHDARRIWLGAASVSALALFVFAAFARSFESALACWLLAGLGLGGTYMPGLRALTDRLPPQHQSRGTAFYTATFGVGAAVSYLWAEAVRGLVEWPWLFAIAGGAVTLAVLLIGMAVAPLSRPAPHATNHGGWGHALRDRRILATSLAYCGHNWELFAFRGWLVAIVTWQYEQQPAWFYSHPGLIAALATLLAVPASILGNEGAHRFGRDRWLNRVMTLSALLALALAALLAGPGLVSLPALVLLLAYAATMNLDSAALTAGLLTETPPERRGKALALYACIGFTGGFIGPVAFGIALDAVGRHSPWGWAAGMVTMGLGVGLGRLALAARR